MSTLLSVLLKYGLENLPQAFALEFGGALPGSAPINTSKLEKAKAPGPYKAPTNLPPVSTVVGLSATQVERMSGDNYVGIERPIKLKTAIFGIVRMVPVGEGRLQAWLKFDKLSDSDAESLVCEIKEEELTAQERQWLAEDAAKAKATP